MTTLRDVARAKLNLTLEVLGRRPDGFHELQSLVAFATFGDSVELTPGNALEFVVEGPFADALGGDNLIIRAAEAAKALKPALKLGRFRLGKYLPVAAGIGGGSADAAAALRLIAQANGGDLTEDLAELGPGLGSDVSVCLKSLPALITGRGEKVELVRRFPACGVLLANSGLPLATAAVYGTLHAAPLTAPPAKKPELLDFAGSFETLVAYVLPRANDLEGTAARLVPAIREVLAALSGLPGARVARLSGSGPTCFGLFASEAEAKRAATALAAQHPAWWIAASTLQTS